jgi:hypothetical protein
MNLETAIAENFSRCTKNELRMFCREAGLKPAPNAGAELMRKELMQHYKITETTHPTIKRDRVVKYRARNEILPPMNLTPEGIWGGRRHRIILGRPFDATKSQKGELFSWNGKNPYRVPFNEVDAVPEPIYNLIMEKKRPVATPRLNEQTGEQYTDFVFEPRFNVNYLGVDPDTADLPGSAREWYQSKGPDWLRKRSLVELNQIADYCGIDRTMLRGTETGKPRAMNQHELLNALMIHFFDNPDVEEVSDGQEVA